MLIKLLLRLVVIAGALLLMGHIVQGITITNLYTALIVAVLWALVNVTLRPILLILTLPINLLTLGLFTFVVSALLFWFLSTFVAGFSVAGFIPALEGSVLLTLVSWVLHAVL
jgi:putative membrane protein